MPTNNANRMAAQHLPRDVVRSTSGLQELA